MDGNTVRFVIDSNERMTEVLGGGLSGKWSLTKFC